MNISTEITYHEVIDKTTQNMEFKLTQPLCEKINKLWKKNLEKTHRKKYLRRKKTEEKRKKEENDDDEEKEEVKGRNKNEDEVGDEDEDFDTQNLCICKLKKMKRTQPLWTLDLSECIVQLESLEEFVFPNLTAYIKSDFL